jgi:hypothetical protein
MDRLAAAVADVRADNVALLTAEELEARLGDLRRLGDQVEACFAETTAAFEATGAYQDVGARTAASWLRHHLRMSAGEARRRVLVGQRLKDLPRVRAAFLAGQIGLAHVQVLAGAVDELGSTAVRAAEESLLDLARLNDPWDLREAIRTLKHSIDPDSVEDKQRQALQRRHFTLTPVGDEYVAKGVLDAQTGAMLAQVLHTLSKPQPGDERSAGQRRVDALADLCRSVLDSGLPPRQRRPTAPERGAGLEQAGRAARVRPSTAGRVRLHPHLAGAPARLRRAGRAHGDRPGRVTDRAGPIRAHSLGSPTAWRPGPRPRPLPGPRVPQQAGAAAPHRALGRRRTHRPGPDGLAVPPTSPQRPLRTTTHPHRRRPIQVQDQRRPRARRPQPDVSTSCRRHQAADARRGMTREAPAARSSCKRT